MKVSIEANAKGGKSIVTLEDAWFDYCGMRICVPAGFASDGASVPRLLWGLLSPCIDPVTLVPSVIHDFIYQMKIGARSVADMWYAEALVGAGYPEWKACLTFFGLKLLGWRRWGTE